MNNRTGAAGAFFRAAGFLRKACSKAPDIIRLRERIRRSGLQGPMKRKLRRLAWRGKTYRELITEIVESDLSVLRRRTTEAGPYDPVVICVIRDDLLRLKLFLEYHRAAGIRAFAFLDDHSSDGTREYLLEQPDVTVYTASRPYTSCRRRAWINLIAETEGTGRWYMVLDSDELFDYRDRENRPVPELTAWLARKKAKCVKAVMVDMFSPEKLYDDSIRTPDDIVRVQNRFDSRFRIETVEGVEYVMAAGGRNRLFDAGGLDILLSKYPLVFWDRKLMMVTSHRFLPKGRNRPGRPDTVLRHYKFLPGDREKYALRVREGNFVHGSREYRQYMDNEKSGEAYRDCIRGFGTYQSYDSFAAIGILEDVWD